MNQSFRLPGLATVVCLSTLLALGGCGRGDERAANQRFDTDVAKRPQATQDKNATAKAGTRGDEAAEATKSMGASAGEKVDDATITAKVNASLAKDKDLSAIRIDVDTQNGIVTLSGPAPTATAKERAAEIARSVKGVNSVNNQLTIKAG